MSCGENHGYEKPRIVDGKIQASAPTIEIVILHGIGNKMWCDMTFLIYQN